MERVASHVEALHLGLADFDAFRVGLGVERAFDFESGLGRRRRDQLDDERAVGEWPAAPVLSDVTEHPVLDPIPFRRTRRIVADLDREPRFVAKFLQFDLYGATYVKRPRGQVISSGDSSGWNGAVNVRQFLLRGLDNVKGEWTLVTMA